MEIEQNWIRSDTPGVYKIENIINGKVYIGSTSGLRRRLWEWRCSLRHSSTENELLQSDYLLFGESYFKFTVLLICEADTRKQYEQFFIDKNKENMYNIAPNSTSMLGYKHTDDSKKKMSIKGKIGKHNVSGIINYNRGRRYNEEHRKNMARAKQKRLVTNYNKEYSINELIEVKKTTAKIYKGFISPEGDEYRNIFNLEGFCRQFELNGKRMGEVAHGKRKEHKGWTVIT